MTGEQYRIEVFERDAPVHGGEAVRLTRIEARPSAVDERGRGVRGQRGAVAGRDPRFPGRAAPDRPAFRAYGQRDRVAGPAGPGGSPSTAAVIKADVLESAGLVIRSVEDYDLVFSSARKP